MRIPVSCFMMAAFAAAMIFPATGLTAMSVEQQDYLFKMEITRDAPTSTFVIGESIGSKPLRPPAEIPVAEKNKASLVLRKREPIDTGEWRIENVQPVIPPVFFDLSSSWLPEAAEKQILAALGKKIGQSTPLQVTGYTCDLGPQEVNDALAWQRAAVVAGLLQAHGYKTVAVTGKGKQGYVSNDPETRHLNRRVEIGALPQPAGLEQ